MGKTSARIALLLLSALLTPSLAQAQDAPPVQSEPPPLPPPDSAPAAQPPLPPVIVVDTPPPVAAPLPLTPQAAQPAIIEDDGQGMPQGYHAETRVRPGLALTGSLVFGLPYIFSVTAALSSRKNEDRLLLLPFLGPLIHPDTRAPCRNSNYDLQESCPDGRTLMRFNAVMQGAGLALIALTFALPKRVFVREDGTTSVTLSAAPVSFGKDAPGLGVVGSF